MRIIKYTLSFLMLVSTAFAGNIRLIVVEPAGSVYHLTIWGRLDQGAIEQIDIKDPAELSKFTGSFEIQNELALAGKNLIRYSIYFCDGDLTHNTFDINGNITGTVVDKVSGSLSYIDMQTTDPVAKSFVQKKIDPQVKATKDSITDIQTLVASKPLSPVTVISVNAGK